MKTPAVILAAILACTAVGAQAPQASGPAEPGPIAYSGHGAVFGPDGREIAITADFIRRAQGHYATQIHRSANVQQRALFVHKASYLADITRGDERAALAAQSQLLDWYIGQVQPAESRALTHKNALLRNAGPLRAYTLPPSTASLLALAGVGPALPRKAAPVSAAAASAALTPRETYIKACRDAGVPVPDTYELGGSGWTDLKELTPLFIDPGDSAKVAFRASVGAEPKGACIALPRYFAGNANTETVGLICLGTTTSKACFFDDRSRSALNAVLKLTDFESGDELDKPGRDVCSDCHAGENSFVIHPKATAFKNILDQIQPKAWYAPLVSKNWPQNPGPGTINRKCSTACHKQGDAGRFPALSTDLPGYCDTVLEGAIDDTMSAYSNLAYADQIKAMRAACKKAPVKP